MPIEFSDLIPGARIAGVVPDGPVSVVFFAPGGDTAGTLTYRDSSGLLNERIVTSDDIVGFDVATERRWSFDYDGNDWIFSAHPCLQIQLSGEGA